MQLLILLVIVLVIGYWLARSKYHEPIDKVAQQPKNGGTSCFAALARAKLQLIQPIRKEIRSIKLWGSLVGSY